MTKDTLTEQIVQVREDIRRYWQVPVGPSIEFDRLLLKLALLEEAYRDDQ